MVHVVDINDINVCFVTACNFGVLLVAWKVSKNTSESEDVSFDFREIFQPCS